MRRYPTGWRAGLLAATAVALLAGTCVLIPPSPFYDEPEPDPAPVLPENTWVEHLPVDGRLVTCVFRSSYGISCDWENARPLNESTTQPSAPATPIQ